MEITDNDGTLEVVKKHFYELKLEPVEKLEEERAIIHFISTPNIDRGGDIVDPKGMNDDDFAKSPTVFFNHNYFYPIAKSAWRKKKEEGVLAKTVFSKSAFADDIYQMHKEGVLNTWSIGFMPKIKDGKIADDAMSFDDKKRITYFHKWNLLEYSSAPLPMNADALDQAKTYAKSFEANQLIDVASIRLEVEAQLVEYKNKIEEISELQKQFNELLTLKDSLSKITELEKTISELSNEIENKFNQIKPAKVETLGKDKIDSLVKSIVLEKLANTKGRQ